MMRNSPDRLHPLDRALLAPNRYFQALLEQAAAKGLLTAADIERLRRECLTLLADKTRRYNGWDSSSIRVETAQALLESIFFTIGLGLKALPSPEDAADALGTHSVEELYQKGRRRIDALLVSVRLVHSRLLAALIDTPNVYYPGTLRDGIRGFFKRYDPDFFAQETHITADYPLFNPRPALDGIEFIKAYVDAAYYENQFCGFFPARAIHRLMCACQPDYSEQPLNLYEPVLTMALGCAAANGDLYHLELTDGEADALRRRLTGGSGAEAARLIADAAAMLARQFSWSEGLQGYVQASLPLIRDNLTARVREGLPLLWRSVQAPPMPNVLFSYGERMDDALYRDVLAAVADCTTLSAKMAVIRERIHSMADLEDVLQDGGLTGAEIEGVLSSLSLPEIAALSKKLNKLLPVDTAALREGERLLRDSLRRFIAAQPPEAREAIAREERVLKAI